MLELIIAIASGSIFTYFINSINEVFSFPYLIKNLIYVALIFWGLKKVGKIDFRRPWIWLFSLFLGFLTVIGKSYVLTGKSEINPVFVAILGIIWYMLVYIFCSIDEIKSKSGKIAQKLDKKWLRIGLMLLVYGLFWLIGYPGVLHPDTKIALIQTVNEGFSFHYSPLFTVLVGLIYVPFGLEIGTVLLCWCSIIVFTLLANRLIELMPGSNKRLITSCFFILNPIIIMWASSTSKDIFFSMCLVLLCIESYYEITKGQEHYWRNFIVYSAVCCILRNNTVYIFLAWTFVMLIFERKLMKKQILCLLTVSLCFFLYKAVGINLLGFGNDSLQETLSVPLHQLHGVYHYNQEYFSEEEIELIEDRFDNFYWEYYSPQIADSSKEDFKELNKEFIGLYIKTGKENPEQYLNSFVSLTYNSFYSDAVKNTYNEKQSCLFEADRGGYDGESCYNITTEKDLFVYKSNIEYLDMDILMPKAFELVKKMCTKINYERIPVLSKLFSIASYTILYLMAMCKKLNKRNYKFVIAFLPLGILWGTLLLGPCTLYRYYLSFIYATPVLLLTKTD